MDPHGDLAEAIIKAIPKSRISDVVYFNPSDLDFPIAFNILEGGEDDSKRHLIASGLIGVFKKIWADSWGPRMEYILRNAILSLMYVPGSTLLGVTRILVDKTYRDFVVSQVKDPVVSAFWSTEYEHYNSRELPTIIGPIQNKVGQFLSNSLIRNIIGQPKSTLDLRKSMDENKIILVNLSKGKIGEDNSSLLGSMIITKLYLAAMSRVDMPEAQRKDFYLYVDEFQNFATEAFADILSEARKYRLCLNLAHQYIEQLPENVAAAVFGNVGTLIAFRVGPQDAEVLEKEFLPDFNIDDLVNVPKWNVLIKLLIDGVVSRSFSCSTLPSMIDPEINNSNLAIDFSRNRYSHSRIEVEDIISSWTLSSVNVNDHKKASEFNPKSNEKVETHKTNCWVCGVPMDVPFKPDGVRPIYCVDCLKKVKGGLIPEPKKGKNNNISDIKENKEIKINKNQNIDSNKKESVKEINKNEVVKEVLENISNKNISSEKVNNQNSNIIIKKKKKKKKKKKNHNVENNLKISDSSDSISDSDNISDCILEIADNITKSKENIRKVEVNNKKSLDNEKQFKDISSEKENKLPTEFKEETEYISLKSIFSDNKDIENKPKKLSLDKGQNLDLKK
ncbi:hypothetical protein EOM09_03325 [bacterium]|nr:hypothetical protein [bacterium]